MRPFALEKRSVDDLLQSFSVSSYDADSALKATQEAMLKQLSEMRGTLAACLDGKSLRVVAGDEN